MEWVNDNSQRSNPSAKLRATLSKSKGWIVGS